MMRRTDLPRLVLAVAGLVLAAVAPLRAQDRFPTQNPNVNAQGVVEMCLNTVGVAVPCTDLTPRSVKIVAGLPNSPYPVGSFPITAIATGTTGAVVGTLAAFPGRTTYICGVDVSAIGGTAAVGPIVIAGLTGGSFTYQASSTAAGGLPLTRTYTPCIPAATLNTAITITTTADGTATAVDVNAWGFQL